MAQGYGALDEMAGMLRCHLTRGQDSEVEYVHPACPECVYGSIYPTGDRDGLICSMCRTVFTAVEA